MSERTLIASVRYGLNHPSHFVKDISDDIISNVAGLSKQTLMVIQRDIIDMRINSEDELIGPSCDDTRWDMVLRAIDTELRSRTERDMGTAKLATAV